MTMSKHTDDFSISAKAAHAAWEVMRENYPLLDKKKFKHDMVLLIHKLIGETKVDELTNQDILRNIITKNRLTLDDVATLMGVKKRSVQAWLLPEKSVNYRCITDSKLASLMFNIETEKLV